MCIYTEWVVEAFSHVSVHDLSSEGRNTNHEFHDEATASIERLEKPAKNRVCYFEKQKNSMANFSFLPTHPHTRGK